MKVFNKNILAISLQEAENLSISGTTALRWLTPLIIRCVFNTRVTHSFMNDCELRVKIYCFSCSNLPLIFFCIVSQFHFYIPQFFFISTFRKKIERRTGNESKRVTTNLKAVLKR